MTDFRNEKGVKRTIEIPKTGCPMIHNIPLTEGQIKYFCELECSVKCCEEMYKKLTKMGYKVTYQEN